MYSNLCSQKVFFFITHFTLIGIPSLLAFDTDIPKYGQKHLDAKLQYLLLSCAFFLSTFIRLACAYFADVYGHRNIPYMIAFACVIALILVGISTFIYFRILSENKINRNFQWLRTDNDDVISYSLTEMDMNNDVLDYQVISIKYKFEKTKK